MSRLPGHRQHSLAEMQLMSQTAAQRAATRVEVLEKMFARLEQRTIEVEKRFLGTVDALQQAEDNGSKLAEAFAGVIEQIGPLIRRIEALENPPKLKRGRPKGSKNKPKTQPAGEQPSDVVPKIPAVGLSEIEKA